MSFLEKQFGATTRVSRLTGLTFITKNTNMDNLRFFVRFRALGTVYGLLVNGACICLESSTLIFKFYHEIYEGEFGRTVFDIMLVMMFLKVVAGIGTYMLSARKLVGVLNDMASFERHIRFSRDRTHAPFISTGTLWMLARSLGVGAFIASRYVAHEEFVAGQPLIIARVVSSIWSLVSVFVVYIASSTAHTLAAMIYNVLGVYLDHISNLVNLRTRSSSSLYRSPHEWRILQDLRLKYLMLRRIVDGLNDILQYSALLSVTCSLVLLCLSAYFIIHPGRSWTKLVFTACYFVHISLELTELAFAAASLKSKVRLACLEERKKRVLINIFQAQTLHEEIDVLSTTELAPQVVAQLQLFKESLDIEPLPANAFGFFTVDKSLLVSMAACVLSFTILLVQTGQGYNID